MTFLTTFRGKLLLILALMLIATLGFQFYLNYRTQDENNELRERQEQALVAGFGLAFYSVTSEKEYIQDVIERDGPSFFNEEMRLRIRDIFTIDSQWRIRDSYRSEYLPTTGPQGEIVYKPLTDVTDLPPLVNEGRFGEDLEHFPNRRTAETDDRTGEAHALPLETSEGRWHVMVVLQSRRGEAAWRAAQPLVYTLAVLLISSLITFLLVWRFTQPVKDLSNAAREVAEGNLDVRVADARRTDEMGRLAQNFNEMAAELEKKRELEAQLQQAEKSAVVGRLGSAIAHEIRNPLNYINLTLDHMRLKFAPTDDDDKAVFEKLTGQLKAEVARIDQQISDFLNYSRPAKANLRPIEARRVIEDSLRIVEAEAAEKGITIGIVEHEAVPQILGDPEFLRSVFNNLFINAVQSMEEKGGHLNIRITANDDSKWVNFEIADTGNGISEENLSKIFEPYFSTKETGTGLGLAIVQKIVETHNGTIEVESVEGEGTRFGVRLPKAE